MASAGRVRIGNQTAYKAAPPALPFEYALSRGFDAFEWFPDRRPDGQGWDAADLDVTHRRRIREASREGDVSLSVHAKLPADPLDPSSECHFAEALRLAEDLGAGLVNLHLSVVAGPDEYAEALRLWVSRARDLGIRLALENTPEVGPEVASAIFAAIGESPEVVGMCLDIGHANLFHETRNDNLGYLDRLDPKVAIVHVHAHENFGDRDRHLVPFTGPSATDPSGLVGLVDRLKRRGFPGNLIIEQWPDPPSLLDRARGGLRALFEGT